MYSLSTKELILAIKKDYGQNIDDPTLLRYLDKIQRRLFLFKGDRMEFVNGADPEFPYPILETQEGVLEYTIDSNSLVDSTGNPVTVNCDGTEVDVAEVGKVFTVRYPRGYYKKTATGSITPYQGYYQSFVTSYNNRGVNLRVGSFSDIPVKIIPRTPQSPPKVVFLCDPGTTTANSDNTSAYYISVYMAPKRITSINSPLSVDVDKWEDALVDGVVGEIEKAIMGGNSMRAEKFEKVWIKKFREYSNRWLDQSSYLEITRRKFS